MAFKSNEMNHLLLEMFRTSHLPTNRVTKIKIIGLGNQPLDSIEAVNFMVSIFFAWITDGNKLYRFNFNKGATEIRLVEDEATILVNREMISYYDETNYNMFKTWMDENDPCINRNYVMYEDERARLNYYIYSYGDLYHRYPAKKLFSYLLNGGIN